MNSQPPLIGFCAWSGTGKTTLIEQLIPLFTAQGVRVAVIKHTHHNFDIDQRGKDSYRFRAAGATQVVLASNQRIVSMLETPDQAEACLAGALAHIEAHQFDLIIVEGFKYEAFPKIELHRPALQKPLMYSDDASIIALATDTAFTPPETNTSLPHLNLNNPREIVDFITRYFSLPLND